MLTNDSRIYVAGHTGLIGSAFVRVLRRIGYEGIITKSHAALDLTDGTAVDRFFEEYRPSHVILAAGRVGGIMQNQSMPATFINDNLQIQVNVLRAAHNVGIDTLVLFGSSCMYPRECPQPMAETALLTGPPEPTSMAYAISKLAGVQLCDAYNKQYGTGRFISVIPNSAYGPNDNFDPQTGHVLSALVHRFHMAHVSGATEVTLWGSGAPRREFIHAEDIAGAVIRLLTMQSLPFDPPVNVGSGVDHSIRELAEIIARVIGFRGTIRWDTNKPDGAPRKLLDSARMRSTGWQPLIDLERGLHETYGWYRDNLARVKH